MTCPKSAADILEIRKQDNTSDTSTANVEQSIFQLANNVVNKITETITCSKLTPST